MKQQGESSSSKPPPLTPRDKAVSIKIIETQTVHTEAMHFKSVVQYLTGKDSIAIGKPTESDGNRRVDEQGERQGEREGDQREGKGEFDDILKMKHLPPLEELKAIWDDD